jgi:methylated-DNA-[protein]-cysteine S-methyltransferase
MASGFYFYSPELEKNIVILYNIQEKVISLEKIQFLDELDLDQFISQLNFNLEKGKNLKNPVLLELVNLIKSYLSGKRIDLCQEAENLGIDFDYKNTFKTTFAQDVIKELLKVHYGTTISYSDLAARINSKAFRAVGNTMRRNPFPLLIPCHRVINKSGDVGGFMGSKKATLGVKTKKRLLAIEKTLL